MDLDSIKKQLTEGTQEQQKAIIDALAGTEAGKANASTIAKSYWEENIKLHDKKFYDGIDAQFKEKGIEKPEGMKTSEHLILIASSNKDLADKLAAANADPSKSKEEVQNLIDKHKKEIEEITSNYNKTIGEKDGLISSLNQKQVVALKSSTLDKGMSSIKFQKGFSAEVIKDIVGFKKQQLITNSKVDDGKIVWCKADGTPIKGANGVNNATLDEVLQAEFKAYIETSNPGGNAGKKGDQGAGKFTGTEIIVDVSSVKTQLAFLTEFEKVAQANGLSKSDENYNNLYEDAKKRYNVHSLDEY